MICILYISDKILLLDWFRLLYVIIYRKMIYFFNSILIAVYFFDPKMKTRRFG